MIGIINVYYVSGLGRNSIFTNIVLKTNKKATVVALPLVVNEATIEFNCASGHMVHLFGSELEGFMMSRITYFSG